ncbi:hypothetical protein, partial [Campylobacter geochelonis]
MTEFNKEEFIEKRVNGTTDIIKGFVGGDDLDFAKGVVAKLQAFYEDILSDAKTETEAEMILRKQTMGFLFGAAGVAIDLLTATEVKKFNYDIFDGTSKELGRSLHYDENRREILYLAKVAAGVAVEFMMTKNVITGAISQIVDIKNIFVQNHIIQIDYYDVNSAQNSSITERKYIIANPSSNFHTILGGVWSKIKADIDAGLRRVVLSISNEIGSINKESVEIVYHKEYMENQLLPNTFEFRNFSERKIASLLIQTDYPYSKKTYIAKAKKADAYELMTNYYINRSKHILEDLKDSVRKKFAALCLKELKGYALSNEGYPDDGDYTELSIYSEKHLNYRVKFLDEYLHQEFGASLKNGINYKDIATNKKVVSENNIYVTFVDQEFATVSSKQQIIFGYSNNDRITSSGSGTAYIESGLGCDTITTGDGNDIIYTNAKIDDG